MASKATRIRSRFMPNVSTTKKNTSMSGNVSRLILTIELWIFVVPIVLLFLLGAFTTVESVIAYPSIEKIIISILVVISAFSIFSLCWVFFKTIKNQNVEPKLNILFWALIIVGGLIAIISLISNIIPLVEDYTPIYYFRNDLNDFVIGFPLIIVAAHLAYESKKC